MDDEAFLRAFFAATLPRADWTHAAHVRLGFLVLARYPYPEALARIREGIQRYNAAQGNHTGYHETITVAFVRLIATRRAAGPEWGWEDFAAAHPDLLGGQALAAHYDPATLKNPASRFAFVAPDREPLPLP